MAEADELRSSANGGRLLAEAGAAALPAASSRWRALGLALDALLVALIVSGVYFRFNWVNWNQGANLHPDEYGLTSTITRLSIPSSLGEYFNTRLSPISPYDKYDLDGNLTAHGPDNRMRWGQWPITLIRYGAELSGNTGYDELRLFGRRMSALADTLALGVTFLIGWELYGRRAGLLAAALGALAVMQIQQAHFMTVDTFALLFTALAMWAAVKAAKGRNWQWYALFGVFFGMALASRVNLLPLAGEILVAAVIAYAPDWRSGKRDEYEIVMNAGWRLALAGLVAFVTFRVTQPMTFRAETGDTSLLTLNPNPDWVESMKVAQAESSGQGGGPPGEQWTNRPALVFPWINMVVWGMGLPFGLLAWAGFAWAAWRSIRDPGEDAWRRHALPLTWTGGYFLFMGTRWVKSIRYFLPIYPFMALFAAWVLIELWQSATRSQTSEVRRRIATSDIRRLTSIALGGIVLASTLAWAWGYTSIYRHTNTRLQATRWIYQNVPAPLDLKIFTGSETYSEPLPVPFGLTLGAGEPYAIPFTAHVTGTTTGVNVAYAASPFDPQGKGTLRVVLAADPDGRRLLAQADIHVQARPGEDERGQAYAADLPPAALVQGERYYVLVSTVAGGPISISGSTVANENWDEGLPVPFDGRDPFGGLYRGLTMEVHWVDNQDKRQMFLDNLAQADYIILPSQRRLWSSSRLPNTYPMTMEYYRALFDGRLGYDLVAQFQSPFVIGPLQVSDLDGMWAWGKQPAVPPPADAPFNFRPLAAEEAFSVYDHAPVWIFKKRADFDISRAAAVLDSVDLSQVVVQGPHEATNVPTALRLPADRLAEQRAGGTWSAMFNFDGLLNRYEWLGVVAWYLALLVLGLLAFPLTFAAFGGLADRGYPLARTASLLVATWIVWMLASFRVLPFSRGTVALGFVAVALASAVLYWPRRAAISAYVREHKRHILIVEGLALALFTFDLLIRLGNPDLWHPSYGGEKPMVFSFFNAVLKSTSFPPYNPWLAGYYLNYYYYGFVIVAMLTKLLAIVPAFAYNLILPTLFSLTGINAFCAAYNLVASTNREVGSQMSEVRGVRRDEGLSAAEAAVGGGAEELAEDAPPASSPRGAEPAPVLEAPLQAEAVTPPAPPAARVPAHANPYLAGLAAAMLVVVLGNLGQVYTFAKGFQDSADHAALAESFLGDNEFTATLNGFWRVATGQTTIALSTGQWYWNATRMVDDLTVSSPDVPDGHEITEFPFFTFLYADLHAHMIDMPFTLLSLAWAVSYLLGARRRRGWAEWAAVFALGGLALGVPRAANTWDFPLFLTLGVLAVVVGEWVREPRLTRWTVFNLGWRVLLLVGLAFGLYRPFDHWFAAAYSQIKRWNGTETPLWIYLYIHGLFLFILITFLVWETRRWLAETPARVLSHAEDWLGIAVVVVIGLLGGLFVLLKLHVAAAWVALPVMAWAGLLLLRGWTDMPMAKRMVLFLTGTALAMTLFVDLFALEGDRMNTIFKFYIQVWLVLSVAAGAALAWVWAALPEWRPNWRGAWMGGALLLFGAAALYTVTASAAKIRDRFPPIAVTATVEQGCAALPGMVLPYDRGLPPEAQPHSLNGLDYMTWSAYCDHGTFLPLEYDYEAIRWMQDNVPGSPVIAEAQSWDLYRMSSRYTWNTGLPDVVGWDYHTRQHNAAIPTEFVTQRGREVEAFYLTSDLKQALDFIRTYDVSYVVVGPMEQAYYGPSGGLAKFDELAARGDLRAVYRNPGVTIYQAAGAAAASQ